MTSVVFNLISAISNLQFSVWVLVGFHLFILAVLALDLGFFRRRPHAPTTKEAALWSAVWIALALLFALGIWRLWPLAACEAPDESRAKAVEFLTGYLVELSLSVDNLFVFLVIFRFFAVPEGLRHRVLVWGILGAVVMRAGFILAGSALLHFFAWMIYVFAALILFAAYKMLRSAEKPIDPSRNWVIRLARRFLPVLDSYESGRFWVRREGRWYATPLLLVLVVIESTDLVFATDSIPAIFGITRDPFIVYTSNIFAVIGLRSFYFLLANFLGAFRFLNAGLAAVLAFVGVKMILEEPLAPFLQSHGIDKKHLVLFSLGAIAVILAASVTASLLRGTTKETKLLGREGEAGTPAYPAEPHPSTRQHTP
jgi:tellurite resistance protein TerC